jgi:4-carboxymuconolactone decarboxylase
MRVTPITSREQIAPADHDAFDEVLATYNGRVVGPLRVLFHRPELARRISNIGAVMRRASPFPDARELAIIAAAREWDCLYEWYVHEPVARRAGVSEAAIDAVRTHAPLRAFPAGEREIAQYVRRLLRNHRVPGPVFEALLAKHGVMGTVELTATVGFYQIFACVMNAFEVPADGPIDLPIRARNARAPAPNHRPYHGAPARRDNRPASGRWLRELSPRVALITSREALPEEHRAVLDEIDGATGGRGAAAFHVLLHSPELARRAALAAAYMRERLSLPRDVQALAILATARINDCPYLLAAHEPIALDAGVSREAVAAASGRAAGARETSADASGEAVAAASSASDLDRVAPGEAQVIGFARELLATNRVSPATFQSAIDRFGLPGLVELTALIGYQSMIACVLNAFAVQPGTALV